MKKTIILSAAMAFATFGAFAQQSATPGAATPNSKMAPRATAEERAKAQADKINAVAQLSPDQYNKVLEVTKNSVAQRDALRKSGGEGDDVKAKFKAIKDQEEVQLKGILTPEQLEKVKAARAQREGQGHKGE